jgi:hypothetical protein
LKSGITSDHGAGRTAMGSAFIKVGDDNQEPLP